MSDQLADAIRVGRCAGDAPALFILHCDQTSRKAAQLSIQHLRLVRLAMQIGEDAYLSAQQFRNDGNGNVIDRAPLICFELV